jgi:hypothetical protein
VEKASKKQAITKSKQQQQITTLLLHNYRHQVGLTTSQHHMVEHGYHIEKPSVWQSVALPSSS